MQGGTIGMEDCLLCGAPAPSAAPKPSASPGNAQNTLAQPTVWLTIALTTVVCILPVVAFRFLKLNLKPDLSDTVRRWVWHSPQLRHPVEPHALSRVFEPPSWQWWLWQCVTLSH